MPRTRSRRTRSRPRRLRLESLESRRLLAAVPLGATVFDTGEFMLGSVGVVPVFFDSDGTLDPKTQTWTPGEIEATLETITEGVNWWSETLDTLGSVHTLEFVVDDTFATNPFVTRYEPIDRISNDFQLYAGAFLTAEGYGDAPTFEAAVHRFNHDQRLRLGTDWAFSIFVVDSSDAENNQFAPGGSFQNAFAFPGGLFFVMPSTRPASTVAHETGHIFWARDEYPGGGSWTDRRGYYDAQNLNAWDNPTPGFVQEDSIMRAGVPLQRAYQDNFSPASTLAMIGWRDSSGNGVFDVADVPLSLQASGHFDAESGTYHLRGTAMAVPWVNQNSSGPQSDITLNRIGRLEYSIDDGPWIVAATPGKQVAEFDLEVAISEPFSDIRWRVVDDRIGVTSPVLAGSSVTPAVSAASVTGFAFLDVDGDGQRVATEPLLVGATARIRQQDGTLLPAGRVVSGEMPTGEVEGPVDGITLSAEGLMLDGRVGVFPSFAVGPDPVFQAYDVQRHDWTAAWSDRHRLVATLEQPTGEVAVEFAAHGGTGYGRVEAYDAAGNFIARATSAAIPGGETATVTVQDPSGRIAEVRLFGHAGTRVAVREIRYGIDDVRVSDASGTWSFPHLADGTYRLELQTRWAIHEFDEPTVTVDVVGGEATLVMASASRVDSPRHHAASPHDVNGDGVVSALDALLIINDLSRNESRMLEYHERTGPAIDVNNDGSVTALDALLVINWLSRQGWSAAEGEGEAGGVGEAGTSVDGEMTGVVAGLVAGQTGKGVASVAATDGVMAEWQSVSSSPLSSSPLSSSTPFAGQSPPADPPAWGNARIDDVDPSEDIEETEEPFGWYLDARPIGMSPNRGL